MNILRLYYSHVLRLNEIYPFLLEIRSENDVLKKLCRSTFVCFRAKTTNDENFQNYCHQEAPNQICASNFLLLLQEIRNLLCFKDEKDKMMKPAIFRFAKLRSPSWKKLHGCLGDDLFRQLLTKFDIFSSLSFSSITQIVGVPLFDLPYPILGAKRKIDEKIASKFRKRRKLDSGDIVSARKLLYSKDLRESGKSNKFKFCTKIDCSNIDSMIKEIFGIDFTAQIDDIFVEIVQRYQRNCFRGLLDYHCPMTDNLHDAALSKLVKCFIPERNVKNYLSSLFNKIIPENLLGKKNLSNFIDKIRNRIVELRRYDSDSLRSFSEGFKVKDCNWIHKLPIDNKTKHEIVVSLFRWLLRYVFHLIKKSFYATESQFLKNRILFYRKPIWKEIRKKAWLDFIKKCQLTKLSRQNCRLSTNLFGPFGFRFLPKYDSVRPILANYEKENRVSKKNKENQVSKMNKSLKPILAVLQHILSMNKELLGSSTTDFESIRDRWKQFIVARRYTSTKSLLKPLFFVKADVNSCFDSIIHSILLKIFEEDLTPLLEPFYAIQYYTSISLRNEQIFGTHRHLVWPLNVGLNKFDQNLKTLLSTNRRKSVVVVVREDQPTIVSREQILNTLKNVINNHVVKILRKFYVQKQGIAQGSALSILLCNLYLAKLEKCYFGKFKSPESLLMRHVDDFLFVTTEKQNAVDFVKLLLNGICDYNIRSSTQKVVTNFNDDQLNDWFLITDGDNRGVPWCGLSFHSTTGEVSFDDDRLLIMDARDLITVNFCVNPNEYVKQKLLKYMAARSFSICFDDDVNSIERIRSNIWSMFQHLGRYYQSFKSSYNGSPRFRITPEDISSEVARKIISTICKSSPNMQRIFAINRLAKLFESSLKR